MLFVLQAYYSLSRCAKKINPYTPLQVPHHSETKNKM
jgi:hypothetical protein